METDGLGWLRGKSAVATGGGEGIGRATAGFFTREGAWLVKTDVYREGSNALGDRLAQVISEVEVEAVVGDVSVLEDAEAMIEADVRRFWRLDNSSPKREQSSWIP